jgi:hypothetical protein
MEHNALGAADVEAAMALVEAPSLHFRDEALTAMCDELCRVARSIRRQVRDGNVLAALGSLAAVEPLHSLLSGELAARLLCGNVVPETARSGPVSVNGPQARTPGYL